MKWPSTLTLIRHDTSEYNVLKGAKADDPTYRQFLASYDSDWSSDRTRELAEEVLTKFALGVVSDHDTPLTEDAEQRAVLTGKQLAARGILPDKVYLSPYLRTIATYERICLGWSELSKVSVLEDERIRELGHGLATLYNDWRIFFVMHPLQRQFYDMQGPYWYRWPQGENVPDVRLRSHLWIATVIREHAGENVMAITHHLDILAIRANLDRLDSREFIRLDQTAKPINLGVTTYRGNPNVGSNGKLELESYNQALWKQIV